MQLFTSRNKLYRGLIAFLVPLLLLDVSLATPKVPVQECPKIEEYDISGEPPEIKFNGQHLRTVRAYLENLNYYHFKKLEFGDEFSRQFLNAYLDRLDPNKAYLLQADVELVTERFADMIDDYFKQIDLQPLRSIYTQYRWRAIDQLTRNINILKDPKHKFNFNSTDDFSIDRDTYDWHENYDSAANYWKKRLVLELLNLKLSGDDEAVARQKLVRRYKSQLSYLKQEKPVQVLETYLTVLGNLYDPHTNYLSPQGSENFDINISLSLEGIGAVLQTRDEFTRVVRIVPGGPADLDGTLQPDDRIVGVAEGQNCDMIDLVGLRIDDVVKYIRGTKGSEVRLKVIPAKYDTLSEKRELITIVRDKVKLEENAAQSEIIKVDAVSGMKYRFGVIDLPSFYADNQALKNGNTDYSSTSHDVKRLIGEFKKDGVDGVVIDLRQNGGGILDEVVSLTDLFIDSGPVVQIKNSRYRNVINQRANIRKFYDGPLVVLIDRLSASASEIFAAAIQDYGRGIIVGSQTFGKGTVQSMRSLPFGRAKITESKFYRVSGGSTQLEGVYPDIRLPALFNSDDLGESSLDNPLVWDTIRPVVHHQNDLRSDIELLTKKHEQRLQSDIDLRYLQNQIALNQERRDIEMISLNEQQRIQQRKDYENRTLANENGWRKAKGLPLKLAKIDKSAEDKKVLDDNKVEADTVEKPDVILNETMNILTDWVDLIQRQKATANKTNKSGSYANYKL